MKKPITKTYGGLNARNAKGIIMISAIRTDVVSVTIIKCAIREEGHISVHQENVVRINP